MATVKSFEDLECWKLSKDLRIKISKLLQKFPADEKFALVSQTRRAVRSISNNIAEGYGRFHYAENKQFVRISRGSLYEVLDHLIIANEENYIDENELIEFRQDIDKIGMLLNGYINYLNKCSIK